MSLNLPGGLHTSAVLRKQKVGSFTLTEKVYMPKFKLPRHTHERACFSLVMQGSFEERYGTKSRICDPSTVLFMPADEEHSDYFLDNGSRCFHFEIARNWLAGVHPNSATLQHSIEFKNGIISRLIMNLYREFRLMDAFTPLAIEGLTLEMLAHVSRRRVAGRGPNPPAWLRKVVELLHSRYSETLTLLTIAKEVGIHPAHLAREFRKHHGCTVGDYILKLRMENACRSLSTSSAVLSEIALANGFADQSHFSRSFKRFTGMTPAVYRSLTSSR
ncbi:MAG TPA: AraC family transcriptional regulator [Pyrinomonadaceae bacterium]|nr:AraC family transcriptional regulator [Pyrinomonadaceae bacterium]